MKMLQVGLVGCFVLGLVGSSVLGPTSAVAGQGPRAVVKKASPYKKKIIGQWERTDFDNHWTFTKDGKLFASAFGSKATRNRYEVEGRWLKISNDQKNTPGRAVFTIIKLTATDLILVDPNGNRIELRKVQSVK